MAKRAKSNVPYDSVPEVEQADDDAAEYHGR